MYLGVSCEGLESPARKSIGSPSAFAREYQVEPGPKAAQARVPGGPILRPEQVPLQGDSSRARAKSRDRARWIEGSPRDLRSRLVREAGGRGFCLGRRSSTRS